MQDDDDDDEDPSTTASTPARTSEGTVSQSSLTTNEKMLSQNNSKLENLERDISVPAPFSNLAVQRSNTYFTVPPSLDSICRTPVSLSLGECNSPLTERFEKEDRILSGGWKVVEVSKETYLNSNYEDGGKTTKRQVGSKQPKLLILGIKSFLLCSDLDENLSCPCRREWI